MKKNRKYVLGLCLALISCLFFSINAYATTSVQYWDLVDSGKHLDWGGGTQYQSNFDGAVNTWNAYKPGVIRKDTALTVEDVYVWDYYTTNDDVGLTDPNTAEIRFNIYNMQNLNSNDRKNACMHELGHALGLEHNEPADVMYKQVNGVTVLTQNDKDSYNLSYTWY